MQDPIHWADRAASPLGNLYEEHIQAHADAVGELKLRARSLDKGLRSLRAFKTVMEKLSEQHREHARTLGKLGAPHKSAQLELGNASLQLAWSSLAGGIVAGSRHHAALAAALDADVIRPLDEYSSLAPRTVRAAVGEAEACERRLIAAATNATRAAAHIVRSWEELAAMAEAEGRLREDGAGSEGAEGPAGAQLGRLLEMASDARDAHVVLESKAHTALADANGLHAELHGRVLPAAAAALLELEGQRLQLLEQALRKAAGALAALPAACSSDAGALATALTTATAAPGPARRAPAPQPPRYALPPKTTRARAGAAEALLQRLESAVSRQNSGSASSAVETSRWLLRAAAQAVSSAVTAVTASDGLGASAPAREAESRQLEIGLPTQVRHVGHAQLGCDGALSMWGEAAAVPAGALVLAEPAPHGAPGALSAAAPRPAQAAPAGAGCSHDALDEVDESAAGWLGAAPGHAHRAHGGRDAAARAREHSGGAHAASAVREAVREMAAACGARAGGTEEAGEGEPVWYYLGSDVSTQGPISLAQLSLILEGGAIEPGAYVWREGMADWQPARAVDELQPALLQRPREPPPPPPEPQEGSGARGARSSMRGAGAGVAVSPVSPCSVSPPRVSAGGSARRASRRASARALVERDQCAAADGADESAPFAEAVVSFQKAKMRHVARKSMLPQVRTRAAAAVGELTHPPASEPRRWLALPGLQ